MPLILRLPCLRLRHGDGGQRHRQESFASLARLGGALFLLGRGEATRPGRRHRLFRLDQSRSGGLELPLCQVDRRPEL